MLKNDIELALFQYLSVCSICVCSILAPQHVEPPSYMHALLVGYVVIYLRLKSLKVSQKFS